MSRILSSARARFIATMVTVLALVALGGVSATPAFAAGSLTLTVIDDSTGGGFGNQWIELTPSGGAALPLMGTEADGTLNVSDLAPGDYTVNPVFQTYFKANTQITIADGVNNDFTLHVDRFHFTGTLPVDASTGTTVTFERAWGDGTYVPLAGAATINSGDGTFDVRLVDGGTVSFRLAFHPSDSTNYADSYSAEFAVDTSLASKAIGAVTFANAGTIRGSVVSDADINPISGATVHAYSGGTEIATAATTPDGSFVFKFPAEATSVILSATAPGFRTQFFAGATSEAGATTVSLTSGNSYTSTDINFSLTPEPADLSGNLIGGGGGAYSADILLYKADGSGIFASTPYASESASSSFLFADLPDGTYRLAFRDSNSLDTLVSFPGWSNSAPGGECYLEVGLDSAGGDVTFPDLPVGGQPNFDYCGAPAYTDPSDAVVTGTVTNYSELGGVLWAKLYHADGTLVDSSQVDPYSGAFSLSGVRDSGDYYIKVIPYATDPFLPMLLGDAAETAWAKDHDTELAFGLAHSFAVDVSDSSTWSGYDITLLEGARVSGTVHSDGNTLAGGVTFTDVDTAETFYAPLGGTQDFSIVLPPGGSYTMLASSLNDDYVAEYWNDVTDVGAAEAIGPLTLDEWGPYEFNLTPSPAVLRGFLRDAVDTDPITAHLYFKDENGLWQDLGQQDTYSQQVLFNQNRDTGEFDGLIPGDYRMRFQNSNGDWLAATQYSTGLLPSWNASVPGPACFVDVTVAVGPATAIDADFDFANQTETCAPEPPTKGDVTGHFESSVATGSVDVHDRSITLFNQDTYAEVEVTTDSNGDFTFADVPNGNYELQMWPSDHVTGTHEYRYDEEFTFSGGADLGDLIATRYGNATGTITDWDNTTMAGATATVVEYFDCGCGSNWDFVGASVEIDEFGNFEAPGITEDGQYAVYIEFADDAFVPMFFGGGISAPDSPFTGVAEQDYALGADALNPEEFVVITGTVFFGDYPLWGASVIALPADGSGFGYIAEVQEDGSYELLVAPNIDYEVFASYGGLRQQYWSGYNYGTDFDPADTGDILAVDADPITGIDFSLIAPDEVGFGLTTVTAAGGGATYSFSDVDVHLYKYVVDGWEEVDTALSDPYSEVLSSGDGDYRLRYSKDGEWLSVDQTRWQNDLPPFSESANYEDSPYFEDVNACYLDFQDVAHGSYIWGDAVLNPDPTALSCGPETLADHHEVIGSIVQSSTFANAPIEDQTVTLTNDSTSYVFTTTTDASGAFTFTGVSPGTYTLDTPILPLASTDHSYVPRSIAVEVDGDEALDPLELTRYGNAEAAVINWDDSTMAGTTARLYVNSGSAWTPVGAAVPVDAWGEVVVRGTEDGEYTLFFDYPAGFVDSYLTDGGGAMATFAATAEQDSTGLETVVYTTVSGTVRLGAGPVSGAFVGIENSGSASWSTTSAANGTFTLSVPAGDTYFLEATKTGLTRDLITNLAVGFAPVTNADLDMHYATFLSFISDGTLPLDAATHLYKQVTGGWQEVASDTDIVTYLWANVGGSYRLRFSDGADWLAVSDYEWDNHAGSETSGFVSPDPDICFIDFAPAIAGADYEISVALVTPPADVVCASEPAVVAPPVPPKSAGSGHHTRAGTEETVVDTEEPTATPSPEPSSSGDGDSSGSGAGDTPPVKPDTTSPTSFVWMFWSAGILALLILSGGAVYFLRRRV